MSAPDFAQVLATEIATVQRFIVLLHEEQRRLREKQVEALEHVSNAKSELAGELEKIGAARNDCLAKLGLDAKGNGKAVEAWIAQQNAPRLQEAWRTLQNLAREAKSLNELNGQCIALLSRNNRERLDSLTRHQSNGVFYSPDGQTTHSGPSRISDTV
jgi:flagellar biosynthesis/type III secretory pathway chaperone